MLFLPTKYVSDIYHIPYKKLKKEGIKYLLFDLDNTLRYIIESTPSKKVKELLGKLKKDFTILIVSNNYKREVERYASELEIDFISFALKPTRRAIRKIKRKYDCKSFEMALIGDQLVTDILGGNREGVQTILVDPISKEDLKITSVNRKIENYIFKKYQTLGKLEKGKYYE